MRTVGATTLAATIAGAETSISGRPNILVIMSDEHNASVLGCNGNAIIRTPHLDTLAAEGVCFQNCYCNSPLCVPSRMTFTAGKYISRTGAWNNDCWLPSDDYPSVARVMTAAGYDSVLCGKMHYDSTRRYGFREVGGNMNASFKTGHGGRRAADDLEPTPGISDRFDDFHPGEHSHVLDHDRAVTAGTVEFIKSHTASDKPFFMVAGYLAPHFPLIVPEEYWDAYKGNVPMPTIPDGFLDRLPLNYKHLRIGFNVEDVPHDIVRKGRELYYGLTQWLDNEVGKVLAALAQSPMADNTVILYTTDHGENMGEHGLWWKNCLYDSAARIPLIMRWPKRWGGGQHRRGACSMVDVVQTIVELGGGHAPEDWDGDSMLAWLDDASASWKDMAVSEYYAHNIASGYAMLRAAQFKYVYHTAPDASHAAQRELYDMEADPGEFNNLATDPQFADRVAAMHAALVLELGEDPDEAEARCRRDYTKGYGRDDKRRPKEASGGKKG